MARFRMAISQPPADISPPGNPSRRIPLHYNMPPQNISIAVPAPQQAPATPSPRLAPAGANIRCKTARDVSHLDAVEMRALRLGGRLSFARFSGTQMEGAVLTGSLGSMPDFFGANVSNADFRFDKLSQARFEDADLAGATFHNTNLSEATFRRASLGGADFSGAIVEEAGFGQVDVGDGRCLATRTAG